MQKKFVLRVKYGTGEAYMETYNPDLVKAIQEFQDKYKRALPDTKMYGLPPIISASIHPLMWGE
jgi:hypothetical protein